MGRLLTRLEVASNLLPRGAMRIKEATMIGACNARPIILYIGLIVQAQSPIYKITDAVLSDGIIVASFALRAVDEA